MRTDPMRLGALSLDDLTALNGTIGALAAAGHLLVKAGLTPTFDLTPRQPMMLMLDFAMPVDRIGEAFHQLMMDGYPAAEQTGAASPYLGDGGAGAAGDGRDGGVLAGCAPIVVSESITDFAVQAPSLSGQAEAPAGGRLAGALDLIVSSDSRDDDSTVAPIATAPLTPTQSLHPVAAGLADPARSREDTIEREEPAAAAPVAAAPPAAGAKNTTGVKGMPDRWTDLEDGLALKVYGAAVRLGVTKEAGQLAVAKELGRPFLGVQYRFRNKLAVRVARLTAAILLEKAGPVPKPDVAIEKPAAPVAPPITLSTAGATHPAKVVARTPITPLPVDLAGHLAALPVGRGWNRDWDTGLMEMACDGFDMGSIAADLRTDAGAVKARFDALTGLYKDANDKACRRFTREQVRDQLNKTTAA